jgi:hypothetical protein
VEIFLAFYGEHWDEVAAVQLAAVDAEQVHLRRAVGASHVTLGRKPAGAQPDDYHVPARAQPSPLHLHSPEAVIDVKREVHAPVLSHRQQHPHAGLHGGEHDRLLSNVALDVGVLEILHANTCSP